MHSQDGENPIDPITLEIYWNRLIAIMDETDRALVRSAFSAIVVEGRDFACILLDRNGESLAQSVFSTTGFTATLPPTVKAFLKRFPADTLEPGDVLITNDPWLGTGHLPDVSIVLPVFHKDALIGFMGTAAHMADIGGNLSYFENRDVFEEGFYIPPLKLYRAGRPNEDLFSLIGANVRVPDVVIGDIRAIVGAEIVGSQRLVEFLDDYEMSNLELLSLAISARSDQRMRDAIQQVPDGAYLGQTVVDGHGVPITIKVAITVRGDHLHLYFGGTSDQVSHAAINCPLGATTGGILTSLKCMLVPDLPNNTALFRPISIDIPKGSILNCSFPAPVKGRSTVGAHAHEAIFAAMASAVPDQVQASGGSFWGVITSGRTASGHGLTSHMLVQGGKGAVSTLDGLSATNFPGNGGVTPTEVFENQVPLVVSSREFWTDSAGPGKHRGGLGQRLTLESLTDEPIVVVVRSVNVEEPATGLNGGLPGAKGQIIVNGVETVTKTVTIERGDRLELRVPGGGGFGDAAERDAEAVERDVYHGYVSAKLASEVYGLEAKALSD